MPKGKELSDEEKRIIQMLKKKGKSNIYIANLLSRTKSTIGKFLQRVKKRGNTKTVNRSGRPKCTNLRIDKRIQSLVSQNNRITCSEIQRRLLDKYELQISKSTIRRRIHKIGLAARTPTKIPYVSAVNRRKRLAFYEEHAFKYIDFWKRNLWSDETKIELKYHHGRMHVWRKTGEHLTYECANPTFKCQTRGIMIWGCMTATGVGKIYMLEGTINSRMYLEIVKDTVEAEARRLIGPDFIFQQDNAPIHTAKIVKQYFRENDFTVLNWPPQSPDLSPIENLWDHLKTKISDKKPRNLLELRKLINVDWIKIEPDCCRELVESIPHRLCLLKAAKGGHTGH